MRITYTDFVPDPKLRGTTTNLPAHIAQVLIASGQATAVPYKGYQERLAAEFSTGSDPHNVDPNATGVEWGIKEKAQSPFSQTVIIRRQGAETTYYSAPPSDCPPSINQRFASLTNAVDPEVVRERAVQEGFRQAERQKAEKVGVLRQILGK